MTKVAFVGAHDLMVPLINKISETNEVLLYESGLFTVCLSEDIKLVSLDKTLFGIEKLIKGEVSVPWYLKGLNKKLTEDNPDVIVVLDFIRFWYWQVIWYRWRHKGVRVLLYTETQRVPRSLFSKLAFNIFKTYFIKTSSSLSHTMTFTNLGADFISRYKLKISNLIVPPIVDTELFKPETGKTYLPDGALRILMNARYVPYKRHEDLLKAIAVLLKKGIQVKLTLIGRGGNNKQKIANLVEELGIQDLVTFINPVPREKLSKIYSDHDVLVLPSDNEAIGMVVPEAMACGLATVTSDSVGANVYVKEGETGYIFKTGNVKEIYQKLEKLTEPSLVEKLGKASFCYINSVFSNINNTSSSLLGILNNQ